MLISKHFGNKSGKSNDMDTACQHRHALGSEQVFNFNFFRGATAPSGPRPSHNQGFRVALRHTTVGSTPLDERSAQRRGLNLTTHNTYDRHPMSSAGFKPTIQASGRPLTLTLDRATTGTGGLSQLHCCAAVFNVLRLRSLGWSTDTWKTESIRSFQTSETTYPATLRHMPEAV